MVGECCSACAFYFKKIINLVLNRIVVDMYTVGDKKFTCEDVHKKVEQIKNPLKAKILSSFFKTGKGQYGEGDIFYGITVPESRKIAKQYASLQLPEIRKLLGSKIHEERLISLFILILNFEKADDFEKEKLYSFYLANTKHINNWDLVDTSAYKIVGAFLFDKDPQRLTELVRSKNMWERRIAIVSTFAFIRKNKFQQTLRLATLLLEDKEDLMHKAVGWMLREVGKRDVVSLEAFLLPHYKTMPRTMLRYAIEKFPEITRKKYLKGLI